MIREIDAFYLNQEEPNRACLLALRSIILAYDSDISETKKYGMPCFYYQKKILCYLWTDKKTTEPYVLMADGNLIDHPCLEQGSRSRMKIYRVDPSIDLPRELIEEILKIGIMLKK